MNKKLNIKLFLLAFISGTSNLLGQSPLSDTLYVFKGINFHSNRLNHFSAGNKITTFDSLTMSQHRHQNLGDLLAEESGLFVKSYGLNSLASASFRGGSASQTAILWNGFNISSPMNGQIDLSLIPVNFCDAISIQHGGSSALWGSGAMGGAIHLNNLANYNKGITLQLNLGGGSFGSFNKQAALEISKKKFVTSIKFFQSEAKNNFLFNNINTTESIKRIQSNAEIHSQGFLNENHLIISKNQRVNLMLWVQQTNRQLPPTLLQMSSQSKQNDQSVRLTSEWQLEKRKTSTTIRTALFDEALRYQDYPINSYSHSRSFISEIETKYNLNKNHAFNAGINNTYSTAKADGYQNTTQLNRLSFFTAYAFTAKNNKLKANVSIRKEFVEHFNVPMVYAIGSSFALNKNIKLKANAAKVYRLPTFNDWYWNPGGNPNLLPEHGYTQDIGFKWQFKTKNKRWYFATEPTLFNKQIENWIIWLPNTNYWEPQNIMKVWSRGIETNSTICWELNQLKFSTTLLTNYVVSTNENKSSIVDAAYNKQLIYVPMYSGQIKFNIGYKKLNAAYRQSYTGYRYTSSDNSEFLNPYQLGSLHFSYQLNYKKWRSSAFLQVNNVWNTEYQIMANRAMPLRNYALGITFEINHK
jgi:vitamin B12 transporter